MTALAKWIIIGIVAVVVGPILLVMLPMINLSVHVLPEDAVGSHKK